MKLRRKPIVIIGSLLLAVPLVALLVIYLFRDNIIGLALDRATAKVQERGLKLNQGDIHLSGLNRLEVARLSLTRPQGDTLFTVDSVSVSFSPWSMLFGEAKASSLYLNGGRLNLRWPEDADFLRDPTETSTVDTTSRAGALFTQLTRVHRLANLLPGQVQIERTSIKATLKNRPIFLGLRGFTKKQDELEGLIDVGLRGSVETFKMSEGQWVFDALQASEGGEVDPTQNVTLTGKLSHHQGAYLIGDLLNDKAKGWAGFLSINFGFNGYSLDNDQLLLELSGGGENLSLFHPSLAKDSTLVRSAQADLKVIVADSTIRLDSLSHVVVNEVDFGVTADLLITSPLQVNLAVESKETDAQVMFNALPQALFPKLQGITATGKLKFAMRLVADKARPWATQFRASLQRSPDFRVTKWGPGFTPGILNTEFTYRPYQSPRSFDVGPSEPMFTPYAEIPTYIPKGIVTTEDATFWSHQGFYPEAVRQAIAGAISSGGTSGKGGSTISQQLVKNVFLSRDRLVARKLEEAMMTWLIETLRISSKQRMMEVYLNVIEWGPEVYGVREAAGFYFDKFPGELTLSECLYLCLIVPAPKSFPYFFNEFGEFRSDRARYFNHIANTMLRRGLISEEERMNAAPFVQLTGPARELIKFSARPTDTLDFDPGEFEIEDPDLIGPPLPPEF